MWSTLSHGMGGVVEGLELWKRAQNEFCATNARCLLGWAWIGSGVGDQELQSAGDDFEFDGEAGEGFAVDLGVDGIVVERLADYGLGFVVVDAFGAAEFSQPERWQVAEVFEAAAGSEGEGFELILVEVGAGGDFERPTVVFGAADDYE